MNFKYTHCHINISFKIILKKYLILCILTERYLFHKQKRKYILLCFTYFWKNCFSILLPCSETKSVKNEQIYSVTIHTILTKYIFKMYISSVNLLNQKKIVIEIHYY